MRTAELDQNATTRPAEAVIDALLPWLRRGAANPSSPYPRGEQAAEAMSLARGRVAKLLGARKASEIVFTSGGSESISAAFASAALLARPEPGRRRLCLSRAEHSATKANAERWARDGFEIDWLPVDAHGRVPRETVLARLDERVALVSMLLANNETGALGEFDGLGAACRAVGARLHVDAVQAPGKHPLDVTSLDADLASISGHKFHGPPGVGALWIRSGSAFAPMVLGGPQEGERRAGTENVAGAVGLGVAAELARERAADAAGLATLAARRDAFEARASALAPGAVVHSAGAPRVPNTTSIGFPGVDGHTLLLLLAAEGVECSAGSACNAQKVAPSPVLLAMGVGEDLASSSLRFSLSAETTDDELDWALEALERSLATLGSL